jgi:hypothetical protein
MPVSELKFYFSVFYYHNVNSEKQACADNCEKYAKMVCLREEDDMGTISDI